MLRILANVFVKFDNLEEKPDPKTKIFFTNLGVWTPGDRHSANGNNNFSGPLLVIAPSLSLSASPITRSLAALAHATIIPGS